MEAMLICFSVRSKKFNSRYERNKFFRGLYGWEQTIRRGEKTYAYRRHGLLDLIPNQRIDESVFIVKPNDLEKVARFFEDWAEKVVWKCFKVLLEEEVF
jgi:threonine dehydrogenase-like Zn-dependent dehydrogenase